MKNVTSLLESDARRYVVRGLNSNFLYFNDSTNQANNNPDFVSYSVGVLLDFSSWIRECWFLIKQSLIINQFVPVNA